MAQFISGQVELTPKEKFSKFFRNLTSRRGLVILVIIFFVLALPVTIYFSLQQQTVQQRAAKVAGTDFYGRNLNYLQLFGQKTYAENSLFAVNAYGIVHGAGVVIDKASQRGEGPDKVYVIDKGNNRALGYNGIGYCSGTKNSCTTDNDCGGSPNSCVADGTKPADIVFGQDNFEGSACNRDNNLGYTKNPDKNTLCLTAFPFVLNVGEEWNALNFDVDNKGNLYAIDPENDRVIKYNKPFDGSVTGGGDTMADFVWGQPNFNSNNFTSPPSVSATSLDINRFKGGYASVKGVSVDSSGNVWIADTFNHRVLRFPPDSNTANLVLGQNDFTSNSQNCSAIWQSPTTVLNMLCQPLLARVDATGNTLYVLDAINDFLARFMVYTKSANGDFTNSASNVIMPHSDTPLYFSSNSTFDEFYTPPTNPNYNDPPCPKYGNSNQPGCYAFNSTGFSINPLYNSTDPKFAQYKDGIIWQTELQTKRSVLIDTTGKIIAVVGLPDTKYVGEDGGYYSSCSSGQKVENGFNLLRASSAVAFDSANNVYIADEDQNRIASYILPFSAFGSGTCPTQARGGLFPGTDANVSLSDFSSTPLNQILGDPEMLKKINSKFTSKTGLTLFQNQLITLDDGGRNVGGLLKVWNNYSTHTNFGDSPDYVVKMNTGLPPTRFMSQAIDDSNRLWIFTLNGGIAIYQLPITMDNQPVLAGRSLFWNDDPNSQVITYSPNEVSFAFDKVNKTMWLNDVGNNRILRIKNYNDVADPNKKLLVDAVLGQPDKLTTGCNRDNAQNDFTEKRPVANGFCVPTQLQFDKYNNLYVVEDAAEGHGNLRITMFKAEDIQAIPYADNVVNFPNTSAVKAFVGALNFPGSGYRPSLQTAVNQPGDPLAIAFDSNNRMIVGSDGYYGGSDRQLHVVWVYNNPQDLTNVNNPWENTCPHADTTKQPQCPDYSVPLPISSIGEIAFDHANNDNLLIQDGVWARTWGINLNTDPSWLVSNIPPTPTRPIPTNSPTPKPTRIPTPSPTPGNNIINWTTSSVSLQASNFYLQKVLNSKTTYYYLKNVKLSSDLTFNSTNLQVQWTENNTKNVLNLSFKTNGSTWSCPGGTLSFAGTRYDPIKITNNIPLGQSFTTRSLEQKIAYGKNNFVIIHFDNLNLQAFTGGLKPTPTPTPTPSPYKLSCINNTERYSISADNFYITTNGKKYIPHDKTCVVSPTGSTLATIITLFTDDFFSREIRISYNRNYGNSTWIMVSPIQDKDEPNSGGLYYYNFNVSIDGTIGMPYTKDVLDLISTDDKAQLHFENLKIQVFK